MAWNVLKNRDVSADATIVEAGNQLLKIIMFTEQTHFSYEVISVSDTEQLLTQMTS